MRFKVPCAGDSDYTLKNEAVNFLNRYNLVPVIVYEHIDARERHKLTLRANIALIGMNSAIRQTIRLQRCTLGKIPGAIM